MVSLYAFLKEKEKKAEKTKKQKRKNKKKKKQKQEKETETGKRKRNRKKKKKVIKLPGRDIANDIPIIDICSIFRKKHFKILY